MPATSAIPSRYAWERYWVPREQTVSLADGGYLYDPKSETGRFINPQAVALTATTSIQCVALLGEPGIGKSTAIELQLADVDALIQEMGGSSIRFDLREYPSDNRLASKVFGSREIEAWKTGDYPLFLFLDSLDESLMPIGVVAAVVLEELRTLPLDRLFLRVACRTADWPSYLEDGLRALWEPQGFAAYELAPLRRIDVKHAAESEEIDADAFLKRIDEREAVPLAAKPITLRFLLNTYKRGRELPSTQSELYEIGCRILCEESNEARRAAGKTGHLSADQRLAIASRIAAVTVFANRTSVWTTVDSGEVPDSDVVIPQLLGGNERPLSGDLLNVSEAGVRETLGTGLFSSPGKNRIGWAHQTFAEFLAAKYLVDHGLTTRQIRSLLEQGDAENRIVPQLREAAAWVAGMRPDVFRQISKHDPQVLLLSDVATADSKDRKNLVNAVLKVFDEDQALDRGTDLRSRYRKLDHPGLHDQLLPFIRDLSKGIIVRRVATDIAEACALRSLQSELLSITLDDSESYPVRINACYAVARIGDDATRSQLLPLAKGVDSDTDDELKGCSLTALWPSLVTSKELFDILSIPKTPSLFGAYWAFMHYGLIQNLEPKDLPAALHWVGTQGSPRDLPGAADDAADAIMLKAWKSWEPPLVTIFAQAAVSRLVAHDHVIGGDGASEFASELVSNVGKRHALIDAMVPAIIAQNADSAILVFARINLVLRTDFDWLLSKLRESDDCQRPVWLSLVRWTFDWQDLEHRELLLGEINSDESLADEFAWLITPVELSSDEAMKQRNEYRQRLERENRRSPNKPLLSPRPEERVARLLDAFEHGDVRAWWQMNLEFTLEPDSTHYDSELEADITEMPGWKNASEVTKLRIVAAARTYLDRQDAEPHEWLGKNNIWRPAFAGYRALRLVAQEARGLIESMSATVWRNWLPIVLAYPLGSESREHEFRKLLLHLAFVHAPDVYIKTLLDLISKDDQSGVGLHSLWSTEECWNDDVELALLELVLRNELRVENAGAILGVLLNKGSRAAQSLAECVLKVPLPQEEGEERQRAAYTAHALLTQAPSLGWETIWQAFEADPMFGRSVLEMSVSEIRHEGRFVERLTAEQIGDLLLWLLVQYPPEEDPRYDGAHFMGPRDSVAWFRNGLLEILRRSGDLDSVSQLRRISSRFPDDSSYRWMIIDAEEAYRRRSWIPLIPKEIIALCASTDARLVQDGDDLLQVLIESFDRLQGTLYQETPAIRDIWDHIVGHTWRPIDENAFSDYVKRFLDRDLASRGVVVNREVVIRPRFGDKAGERTDIHVDAIRQLDDLSRDTITAVVEVKGCWHSELGTAMKTQLTERYLAANSYSHGIYLVGWFVCGQWDTADSRTSSVPKWSLDQAQAFLKHQAETLSRSSGVSLEAYVMNTALQ